MYHNLYIQTAANSFLVIFWHGERAHNAYWILMGDTPVGGAPFTVTDGPFPNQYMAAADFFKRGPGVSRWVDVSQEAGTADVAAEWEKRYGVNFKGAFHATHPDAAEVEGVVYSVFVK